MGRCSHLSNCLQEKKKNPERENWVADDLFSDSIDSIIVIFILFLPFLWCSVKLSSLSVSFHFFEPLLKRKKKRKKISERSPLFLLYTICSSVLSASALKLIWFTVLFLFFPLFLLLLVFLFVFAIIIFLQLIMVLHAKYCMRCTIEDYL